MPGFSFKSWLKCARDPEWLSTVRQINAALDRFAENPTGGNLHHVKKQIQLWTASHPRWREGPFDNPPAVKPFHPISEALKWVDALKEQFAANQEAMENLGKAARLILET